MAETKERHLKKYTTLSTKDQQKQIAELQNKITIDKSKWEITSQLKNYLPMKRSSEKRFEPFGHSKNIPTKNIVAKVEAVVENLPMAKVYNIRAKTSLVLQKASPPKDNLSKKQRRAVHSLKEDKEITILPADKGRATVILNNNNNNK